MQPTTLKLPELPERITFFDLRGDFVHAVAEAVQRRPGSAELTELVFHTGDVRDVADPDDTAYISPGNSLGFMDGGIDYVYSRVMFPGIEQELRASIVAMGRKTLLGRPYLRGVSFAHRRCSCRMTYLQRATHTMRSWRPCAHLPGTPGQIRNLQKGT